MVSAKQLYLAVYNGAETLGWSYIAYLLARSLILEGKPAVYHSYATVAEPLKIVQGIAIIVEVLNALLGITSSAFLPMFLQLFGRVVYVFCLMDRIPQVLHYLQTFGELVRYPFYTATALGSVPSWLTWLRYSAFLALYPIGILSEGTITYQSLPFVEKRQLFSTSYFSFYYFLVREIANSMSVVAWSLLSNMLQQRRKKLYPTPSSSSSSSSTKQKPKRS